MIILEWINSCNLTLTKAAKRFGITYNHLYNYIYHNVIPTRKIMIKIFQETGGMVTPNDFYGITPAFIEKVHKQYLRRITRQQALI